MFGHDVYPCSLHILFFSQVVQTERVVYVRSACVF